MWVGGETTRMSLQHISDIHEMPVLDLETGEILGQVLKWIVRPDQQKLVAYVLMPPTLWRKARVVSPTDIVEYGPKMIVVRDQRALIAPDEIMGLSELIQADSSMTGFRAETESGKLLGTVIDFVIDIVTAKIQQYHIKPQMLTETLQGDWVLPAGKVIKIENRKIIFPDNILVGIKFAVQQHSPAI